MTEENFDIKNISTEQQQNIDEFMKEAKPIADKISTDEASFMEALREAKLFERVHLPKIKPHENVVYGYDHQQFNYHDLFEAVEKAIKKEKSKEIKVEEEKKKENEKHQKI